MTMTVVVTRNSPERTRGFLASCMSEIAPGVYTAPKLTRAVRDRVWEVMEEWFGTVADEGVLMTWVDNTLPGRQAVRVLGLPRMDLVDHSGVYLARRDLPPSQDSTLTSE